MKYFSSVEPIFLFDKGKILHFAIHNIFHNYLIIKETDFFKSHALNIKILKKTRCSTFYNLLKFKVLMMMDWAFHSTYSTSKSIIYQLKLTSH